MPPATATEELLPARVAQVNGGVRIGWMLLHSVTIDQNEMIGSVADFVVGRDSSLYVILQIGSFVGLDTYLIAVPFKTLVIDKTDMRIRLPGATREALRNFPQFHFSSLSSVEK